MKKIGLLALGLALALGVVAEAGSIPADRVPLQTYAVKKMNCYLQPNGVQKGWIDPGDYVVVTQIRSDGWAYGSYPVGNGRVSRWFRADDLVNNIGFANQERYSPKANTNTYTGPDHSRKFGSFNDNETLLVVSESGESRQFIYKLNNGGYKMAWAPYWDCWDARQAGKQQVNNNVINKNPIVKPVQREDKKQEQSSSYGVWKATARYTANTYDNPDLRGARAGWITSGSDIEVLGENAKSYFIRYWADNGAKRERYVERTAVKGLNEDKENKKQVNNNVINKNPIVKPVQREDKKQEQSSSYGVWKATARYRANTYDNPSLSGARAGWVTADSNLEVLGENAKSYFIRYWADNGAKRERYVERTAVKGLNEDKENKNVVPSGDYIWPIDKYQITCLYYYKTGKPHASTHRGYTFDYMNSIDVSAAYGTPVYATASGVVEFVLSQPNSQYPETSYGRHIIIKHDNGTYSLYAHLSKTIVSKNQKVNQGEKIAESGYSIYYDKNRRRHESNHLHFAITDISPWQYFRDKYNFLYHINCKNNNKNKNNQYSKELIEWFNKKNPITFN